MGNPSSVRVTCIGEAQAGLVWNSVQQPRALVDFSVWLMINSVFGLLNLKVLIWVVCPLTEVGRNNALQIVFHVYKHSIIMLLLQDLSWLCIFYFFLLLCKCFMLPKICLKLPMRFIVLSSFNLLYDLFTGKA